MDITSLYYFSEVAKDLHITQTANRLYISQQTLSNHILRLENQFGAPLLNRKPRLSLTYAGEFVLDFANTVLREQTNVTDILSDIEQNERGVIRFGASTMRMNALAAIFPDFTARYPNVEIRLTSVISQELEPLVSNGELDFAIVIKDKSDPNLVQDDLMQDQIYLCVADPLLQQYYANEAEEIKARSLQGALVKDFAKLPFCIFTNNLGQRIHACFDEAGYTPKTLLTTTHTHICTTIGFQGKIAFFATQANLIGRRPEIPDNMNIFPLLCQGEHLHLQVSLLRHKMRYLTHFSKYFLELLSSYSADAEQTPISRIAAPKTEQP